MSVSDPHPARRRLPARDWKLAGMNGSEPYLYRGHVNSPTERFDFPNVPEVETSKFPLEGWKWDKTKTGEFTGFFMNTKGDYLVTNKDGVLPDHPAFAKRPTPD